MIKKAKKFATKKHSGQTRKGKDKKPYTTHFESIEAILREKGIVKKEIIALAWLHDTLEDTSTTFSELEDVFGTKIANDVLSLTKVPEGGKIEFFDKLKAASPEARILKLADRASNLREMTNDPPVGWKLTKIEDYIFSSSEMYEKLFKGCTHPGLEAYFEKILTVAYQRFLCCDEN